MFKIASMFCRRIFQDIYLVIFTRWFLVSRCCCVITFQKQDRLGPFSYFSWVGVHFGSHYNYIVLNSGTLVRKIKCKWVQCYYSAHTYKWFHRWNIPVSPKTFKTLQKEYYQKHFFLTQGKTRRGKLKHKRNKALSVIILANMFHFP